ncbi:hypothetical protein B9Z55_027862 [Caenorhabditis nigoni]|uniref:Uncharacterized protein n=1 Tax=Caenorhabditis nigoni TaxID=1611254 RepID=A0A2G5SE63_9PELO|nr:hypothetical protein B9Z55_027862 [Caenorhabditis nigoni]
MQGSSTRDNRRTQQTQSIRQSRPTTRSTANALNQRSLTKVRRSRSRGKNVRFASPPRQGSRHTRTDASARNRSTSIKTQRPRSASRHRSQSRGHSASVSERYKKSSRWLALACLKTGYIVDRNVDIEYEDFNTSGYTQEVVSKIRELTKEVKVDNCNTMSIPRNILTPMHQNYRGLDHKIDHLVITDYMPNGIQQAQSNSQIPTIPIFTGKMFVDVQVTAKDIVQKSNERIRGFNTIHDILDRSNRAYLMRGDDDSVLTQELKFFAVENSKRAETDRKITPKKGYLPVRRYKMEEHETEPFDKLHEVVETSSICLIDGLCDAINFKREAFTLPELLKAMPGYKVTVSRQISEAPEVNMLTIYDKKLEEKSNGWRTNDIQHDVSLKDFVEYYERSTALSIKALQKVKASPENAEDTICKLQQELKRASLPVPHGSNIHPDATVIAFGTNIDINPANTHHKLKRQLKNIDKLPMFLRPTKKDDLMEHVPEVLAGINTPQVYGKVSGVKTYPHIENGC